MFDDKSTVENLHGILNHIGKIKFFGITYNSNVVDEQQILSTNNKNFYHHKLCDLSIDQHFSDARNKLSSFVVVASIKGKENENIKKVIPMMI